jgi:predicted Zn-ribbon and HTH transcriptional regulator
MPDSVFRPGDQHARIKNGDLRDIQKAECQQCHHQWVAPVIGRCPRCRAEGARVIEQLMIGAPRV